MKSRDVVIYFLFDKKEKRTPHIAKEKPQKISYCFSQQVSEESCLKTSLPPTEKHLIFDATLRVNIQRHGNERIPVKTVTAH